MEVQDWGGEWWEYDITFAAQSGPLARSVSAALTALGSGRGLLLFADPSILPKNMTQPITLATPIAGGNVVQTQGWPHGLPAVASGDFISIGGGRDTRLHQIAFGCDSGHQRVCNADHLSGHPHKFAGQYAP